LGIHYGNERDFTATVSVLQPAESLSRKPVVFLSEKSKAKSQLHTNLFGSSQAEAKFFSFPISFFIFIKS